jgi:hypothetical protein
MRVFGSVILFSGYLICLPAHWLPLGLVVMGVGLILLLMSENRKSAIEGSRHQHSANPIRVHERVRLGTDAAVSEGEVYSESEEWKRLIENDSELAKVQGILERYGRQYAEQLAEAYRVFNERALLPAIVDMIITSAKLRVERTAPVEILHQRSTSDRSDLGTGAVGCSSGRPFQGSRPYSRICCPSGSG